MKDLAHPEAAVIKVVTTADAVYRPIDNIGTKFWVMTTLDAKNGKVITIDLEHPERTKWKTVIPETKNNLESVSMINDTLIANYVADAQSMVELHRREGSLIERLALPAIGNAVGFGGERQDTETFFQFSNFVTPGTIYRLDMKTRQVEPYRAPKLKFDPAEFETKQVFYSSKDGTRVPMFITAKKGLKLDGGNPTLLYGYGGFNISLLPEFSASRLLWMQMGGVYVQANLRGAASMARRGTRQGRS